MDSSVERVDDLVIRLLPIVREVMDVSRWQPGGEGRPFRARYQGQLRVEASKAFDRLEPEFIKEGAGLFLRQEGDSQVFLATDEFPEAKPDRLWLHALLAVATFLTVLFTGLGYGASYAHENPTQNLLGQPIALGLIYAGTLLGILATHEFGHYLAGRFHKMAVSLPFFIPFPGGFLGTFGAFIQLKSRPRNRKHLLDMGLAGPYAGLLVALPLLILGLSLSQVGTINAPPPGSIGYLEGNSLLYLAAKFVVNGELLPAPIDFEGQNQLIYWLRNIAAGAGGQFGVPFPLGGRDVQLHPMAVAAWAGLLVTGINLIPAGQLDGGHSIYSWLGSRAIRLWPFVVVGFVVLVVVWQGWFLFAALVFLMGRTYAQPLDDVTELDNGRKAAAILALIIFILTFTPAPVIGIPGR
ncbi:MAG: site-2 protease family protein [Anaerolineae bacterium]|nr:MAG: site-2 protease family protein [Anaerolineae bacterium]